jgi:hypothetical protein
MVIRISRDNRAKTSRRSAGERLATLNGGAAAKEIGRGMGEPDMFSTVYFLFGI